MIVVLVVVVVVVAAVQSPEVEHGHVGQPIAREYIRHAENTGARWDSIHWNYGPWRICGKGRMTFFHSLIDELGHKRALQLPDAVDLVALALENGADYAIDDPDPPLEDRVVADVPELVWAQRRDTIRLLVLLALGRAEFRGSQIPGFA